MRQGETKAHPAAEVGTVSIFTPHGRDAAVVSGLLREIGIESTVCRDRLELARSIDDSTLFVVVTEEVMRTVDLGFIDDHLRAQPAWSDLPFIVLTRRGGGVERNPNAERIVDLLGNVTFVERPFHPTSFLSVSRSALRARQRQYEARARIEELNETERRLRTALLAGRLGSWELNLSTNTLTASAACKAIFGRGPEDRFNFDDLVASTHPTDQDRMQTAVRHAFETGTDYAIELRAVWPDGSLRWVEMRGLVMGRWSPNRRMAGVSSDITDRKYAEADAKRSTELLEERVRERTLELEAAHAAVLAEIEQREHTERLLRQSQKMETIGQLTGGVAHDFNNLLMAVMGNLDLLRKHAGDDPKAMHFISGALQGVQRGAALTQRLLAFARRQELTVEPTDITNLVRNMGDLVKRSIGSEIELDVELPASAAALVDPNQIELAILNLVINARDAMPRGGRLFIRVDEVDVTASNVLDGGRYVRISVTDTGTGMSAETLRRAIEPFYSTKDVGKGTGLGLSMIQGLAEQLRGTLRLTSELGQGTTAELLLPATTLPAREPAAQPEKPGPEAKVQATILFVDDDALIAMSTVDMLSDLGHNVIEANSGEEALKVLRDGQQVDLLITDYSMPKMNGAQLALAARELRPKLPILLATGYAEVPPGSGIVLPRIGKPYMQSQLADEIRKLLPAD